MKQLNEAYAKLDDLYSLFKHFTYNEWVYETQKIYELEAMMNPQDRQTFYIDPKTYSWKDGVVLYLQGIQRFMWKEDLVYSNSDTSLVIAKNHWRYFDIARRTFLESDIQTKEPARIRKDALLNEQLQELIEKQVDLAPPNKRLQVRKDL